MCFFENVVLYYAWQIATSKSDFLLKIHNSTWQAEELTALLIPLAGLNESFCFTEKRAERNKRGGWIILPSTNS